MILPITIIANGRHVEFSMDLDLNHRQDLLLRDLFQRGMCYEPEVTHVMLRTLKEGDTAIDVGANIGFFTLLMAKLVGKAGVVHAFEPVKVTYNKLFRNLAMNDAVGITFAYFAPVWSSAEKPIEFFTDADDAAGSCAWNPGLWHENALSREKVDSQLKRTMTLDLLGLDRCKLIKIDTEGADQRVLEGASTLLSKVKPPYIIVELNPFGSKQLGCSDEALRAYMRGFGYDLFFLHENDNMPTLVSPATKILYHGGVVVKNCLFSTIGDVARAWPEAVE